MYYNNTVKLNCLGIVFRKSTKRATFLVKTSSEK